MFGRNDILKDKRIAVLATDGFEESELLDTRKALDDAGAETHIVSLKSGFIRSWKNKNWGQEVRVDVELSEADPNDYDGLLLPGGVINSDTLRGEALAVTFVNTIAAAGKPIAAICHAPWILAETDHIANRKLTSWPSLKTDLENAGAHWADEEVIVDHGWVTSRKPADIPAFNKKMIEEFREGRHILTPAINERTHHAHL